MDKIKVVIRPVLIDQLHLLQTLAIDTFMETFGDLNSKANMSKYLNDHFTVQKLRTELGKKNSEFYAAFDQDKMIGYMKLNFGSEQTEIQDDDSVELERIYVLKTHQGHSVGQLLLHKALERSRERKAHYLWLGVWEKNFQALHFYRKNGFQEFDQHIFVLGEDEQVDIMMRVLV